MGEITIKLNGIKTTVPEGITILEAAAMRSAPAGSAW